MQSSEVAANKDSEALKSACVSFIISSHKVVLLYAPLFQPLPSTTMKIAVPQVLKPKAERIPSEEELPEVQQEQPRTDCYKKQESSFVEKVEEVVEKGVNAVDPLNIFTPCIAPTRLVIKHSMFEMEEPYDILECRTKDSYLNLQVTANEDKNSLVIQDTSTGKSVVIIERMGEMPDITYEIFKTSPVRYDQDPTKKNNDDDLFALAKVERTSPKDLQVLMNDQSEPTYMIKKAGIPANYATNYYIKQPGVKEEVASTHPWEGTDVMLVVNPGMDVILMFCLAAIVDDAEKSRRKESFSEMLNPRNLVRKMTSSSEGDKQNNA